MRFLRKTQSGLEEAVMPPRKTRAFYLSRGYLPYDGTLPLVRLSIDNGVIMKLPEPPCPAAVIRYSKYRIVESLGDQWPAFKNRLAERECLELWNAANELSTDNPTFCSFIATLDEDERRLLEKCRIEE